MSEPIALGVVKTDEHRRQLCIELLEKMLAEAKEGRGFETVFFVGTYPDSGFIRNAWTAGLSTFDVIARIEHLKHELLADVRDSDRPGAPPK